MFADADIPEAAPETPAADAWAERKLAILSELAEAGLAIALALKGRIIETTTLAPEPAAVGEYADLARAFDRVSRAVRLSIFLRDKLMKDAPPPPARRDPAPETRAQRADRVRRIVGRVIKVNYPGDLVRMTLDQHVAERLYDRDITGDLEGQSVGALVARICADLGLPPRWRYLAEEAWAQAEIIERPEGSPYAAWPDLPPDEPWPAQLDPDDPRYVGPDPDEDDEDFEGDDEWDDPGGGGP